MRRGWDHSVFIPLKVIYPETKIAIVELSLHTTALILPIT